MTSFPGFEGPSDLVHGLLILLSFEIKPFSVVKQARQGIALFSMPIQNPNSVIHEIVAIAILQIVSYIQSNKNNRFHDNDLERALTQIENFNNFTHTTSVIDNFNCDFQSKILMLQKKNRFLGIKSEIDHVQHETALNYSATQIILLSLISGIFPNPSSNKTSLVCKFLIAICFEINPLFLFET